MSNVITLNTLLVVPEEYLPDAIWNLCGCFWGIFPNLFILVIGIKKIHHGRFQQSIIGMSSCQLYAAITQTILYISWIICYKHQIKMTVLMCSIPRRIFQQTINVALLSILIISIDRYLAIIRGKILSKKSLIFLFLLPGMFFHGIYNTLTFLPMYIGTSDMCGPCLKMPSNISYYLEPIVPICMSIAILINLRILMFLLTYKKIKNRLKSVSVVYNDKELRDMKYSMFGILLQACIPMIFNMPQNINLAMYNINAQFRMSMDAWRVVNSLNYFTLFLNPCVTLLFVKQFRLAALKFVGKSTENTTTDLSGKTKLFINIRPSSLSQNISNPKQINVT